MSKKILLMALVLGAFVLVSGAVQASSTFTALQTVANIDPGAHNDQAATYVTATSSVPQAKASSTLVVVSLPASNTTITIGGCVITFTATDTTNCNGGTVGVGTTTDGTGASGKARSATQIANALLALTNVKNASASSTNLTASASSSPTAVIFTTSSGSTETGGLIKFASTAGGAITNPYSYAGVAPVAQVDTITIGGTPEAGDIFLIGVPDNGPLHTGVVGYTATTIDDTTTKIATGLAVSLSLAPNVDTDPFSVSSANNVVILTAKSAGTAFTSATSSAVNYPGVAQVVTFTPANVSAGDTFVITADGMSVSYKALAGDGVTQVINALLAAGANVVCTNTGAELTCTSPILGTRLAVNYSATVITAPVYSSGGGGGGYFSPAITLPNAPVLSTATTLLTKTLSYGQTNKQIKILQEKLKTLGFIKAPQKTTTYFGLVTKNALIKFQKANKLKPYNGVLNAKTRTLLNSI